MDIRLRQHEDGSYVLDVRSKEVKREIDITHIIREIFLTKLNELQTRVRLEEKYRNWVTEAAQKNQKLLSSVRSRYAAMSKRLEDTDQAIDGFVDEWSESEVVGIAAEELIKIKDQNEFFLDHDDTLEKLGED